MIRSKILLLSNHFHFYAILITLLGLSLSSFYYLIVLIPYLFYLIYLRILKFKLFILLIFFTAVTIFLLNYKPNMSGSYEGIIENVIKKDEYCSYTIKIGFRKILVYSKLDTIYEVGDIIKVIGKENGLGFDDYDLYLKSQHIYSTLSASSIKLIGNEWTILKFRSKILKFYELKLEETSYSYLASLVFAHDNFGDDFKTSINSIGISHLFSISGFHVTMIVILLNKILSKNVKIYIKRNYIIIPFLVLYSFLCANAYGIMRSVLMYILAELNFKKQYGLTKLDICSIVYLGIIFFNPLSLYRLSFQLTFIVTFFLIIGRYLIDDTNKIKSNFKITFIAFLVTIPLVSNIKYELNFITLLISPLFIYIFSILIMPMTYLLLLLPMLSVIFKDFFMLFTNSVYFFDKLKVFSFPIAGFTPIYIIIYYILLMIIFIKIENKKIRVIHYLSYLIFILIMMRLPILSINDEVIMLDVGQGDSCIIKLKHNKGNILIDSYGNNIEEIKSFGITKIDALILTHADKDHIQTAGDVIKYFKCDKLITSAYGVTDEIKSLRKMVKNNIVIGKKTIVTINGLKFNFIAPVEDLGDTNSNSLVFTVKVCKTNFLFTGDMTEIEEKSILKETNRIRVDILKVPHHGANTGLSKDFLDILEFDISLISVGKNNFYGHPHPDILKKLEDKRIYRTDILGTIYVKLDQNGYKIKYNLRLNPFLLKHRK